MPENIHPYDYTCGSPAFQYRGRGNIGTGPQSDFEGDAGNPNPIHAGRYQPFDPVDGRGGIEVSGPYEPVLGWPEMLHPGEWKPGSGRGVVALSPDRVIAVYGGEIPQYAEKGVWGPNIFRDLRFTEVNSRVNPGHRHCHEIVISDRQGKAVDSWGERWFDELHAWDASAGYSSHSGYINRIRVDRYDPEEPIWIVAHANARIFKFSNDGNKLLLKIDAANVPEEYHPHVHGRDVAFLPNGDVLVAHLNMVMRFSRDGEFLSAIGKPGHEPGEFYGIHGIEVHPETLNLYILDRVNRRIQIFDQEGNFVDCWGGFQGAYTIRLTQDLQHLWVSNAYVHNFSKYGMDGRLVKFSTWGAFGIAPGTIWGPHHFDTDAEGNLYVAEDYAGRVQKFRLRNGVDPDDPRVIGPLVR